MNLNVNAKKRLARILVAVLVLALTATGSVFLLSDVIKPASAATAVSVGSVSDWNNYVANRTSGEYDVTLTANITCTSKLNPIRSGVTVNLNLNGKTIAWDEVYSSGGNHFMDTSYTGGSYQNGTYWGLITNNGTLTISGTGTIRTKHVAYNQNDTSKRDNYVQRCAAIVNGSGVLTLGSGVSVESYLSLANTGDSYKDAFTYNCGVYNGNGGTVNTSAKITVGGQSSVYQDSGTNSYMYAIEYGLYGGTINVTGGTIDVIGIAGAVGSRWNCKEDAHIQAYAIGIYSNAARVLGNTSIKTYTNAFASTAANDPWKNGFDVSYSAGVMYTGTNYPVIGPAVTIESTFQHNSADGSMINVPGADSSVYYTGKNDDAPGSWARRAYPVVGVAQNVNTIGLHTTEKTWESDGFFFGTNTSNQNNNVERCFGYSSSNYYAEDPYRDRENGIQLATSTHLTSASEALKIQSGQNNAEKVDANFKNGAPGTIGTQFVIVYRYFDGVRNSANLQSVSYSYDSSRQNTAAYLNVGGTANRTGVVKDASSTIAYGGGGVSRNNRYYELAGTNFERIAPSAYAARNINNLSHWSSMGTTFPSAGITLSTSQMLIVYMDYVIREPSAVRVVAADKGTIIGQQTDTTSFTTEYTGAQLVPNVDFNIAIVDMGADKVPESDDLSDNTIVTNVYDVSGTGSGSGNNSTAVSYKYSSDGVTWNNGLPKDVGTYQIEVTVNADTTFASTGTYNRSAARQYITCEITKANPTISGPNAKTSTYGTMLGDMIPFSDYTVVGKGSDAPQGTWSYSSYATDRYLDAGVYSINVTWTPTPGTPSAQNYNAASFTVSLDVQRRNMTVNAGDSLVGYGDEDVEYRISYENIASCDTAKQDSWLAGTVFKIYHNGEWVDYTAGIPMGTYPVQIESFGGNGDINYNITLNTQQGSLEVGKRLIRYTAVATDRAYQQGNSSVEVTLTYLSGVHGTDTYTPVITTVGVMPSGPNAGNGKRVTVDTDSIEIPNSENYRLVIDNADTLTVNITKADPTGVACEANPSSVVYDATRTLSDIALDKTATAVSGSWSWLNPDAVPTCSVSSYTAVFTPTDSNNYNTTQQQVTINVEKAPVVVSIPEQTIKYGDSVPALSGNLSYTGFTGSDTIDSIATTGGVDITTSYSRGSAAGEYSVRLTTDLASENYSFTSRDSIIHVGVKDLYITANNATITYGDPVPDFDSTDLTATGFYGSDNFESLSGSVSVYTTYAQGQGAGTYPIRVSGYTSNNYNIVYTDGVLTVDKAFLTVKPNAVTVGFGQAVPAFEADNLYTISGFVGSDTAANANITGTPHFTTSYIAGRYVGTYPVNVNIVDLDAPNYYFTSEENYITVVKSTPVITEANIPSATVVHHQTLAEAVFDTTDCVAVNEFDSETVVAGTYAFAETDRVISYGESGFYQVIFTPNDTLNYNTTVIEVQPTVYERAITGKPFIQGSPMVNETLTANLSVMDPSDYREYECQWYADGVAITGATDIEYVVTADDVGKLITFGVKAVDGLGYTGEALSDPTSPVIRQLNKPTTAQLEYTIPSNCVYDGNAHPATAAVAAAYTGYVGDITIKYNGSTEQPVKAGTYIVTVDIATPALLPGDTDYNQNYFGPVSGLKIGEFTIAPASFVVSVDADNKVYDGYTEATATITTSGVIGDDDVSVADGYSFSFDTALVGTDKPVTANGLKLTGADAANYKLVVNSASADITKRTLTVRANGVTKTYDGTTGVDVSFSNISGYAVVDSMTTVSVTNGRANTSSANAGTWPISGITYQLEGSSAGNYEVVISNADTATAVITPAPAQVTAPVITGITYDSAVTLASIDLTPYTTSDGFWEFVNNTEVPTVSKTSYEARFVSTNGNYSSVDSAITINVTPATVTLRANDTTVAYGSARPTFTVTAFGLTGTDTLSDIGGFVTTACTYAPGSAVGQYPITVNSALTSDNYTFIPEQGVLTVEKADLMVEATAANKIYDGSTQVRVNFTIVSGKYGNDDVYLSASSVNGTAASANAGTSTVNYAYPELYGTKAENYNLVVTPAANVLTVKIEKADVTGVIFPTEGRVEFGYNLSFATFQTPGVGEGSFAYENANATVPAALGYYETYRVIFTPSDSRNYNTQSQMVPLTVVKCKVNYVVALGGTPQEGQTLAATLTGLPRLALEYVNYRWYRVNDSGATLIEGEETSRYVLTSEDVGYTIVVVTYFNSSDPFEFSEQADVIDVDENISGIIGQTATKVQAIKLTFWQRLVEWIRRIIAAITGIVLRTGS